MSYKGRQLCYYYAQGKCHFGARCRYLHESAKESKPRAPASRTSSSGFQRQPPPINQLFLTDVWMGLTDAFLKGYFGAFGKVASAFVVRDPVSHSSRGIGFVAFAEEKDYLVALEAVHRMKGKIVTARPANPNRKPPPSHWKHKQTESDKNREKRGLFEGRRNLERLQWM